MAFGVPEIHVDTCTCNIKLPQHTPHTRQAKAQILSSFICWSYCKTLEFVPSLSTVLCKVLYIKGSLGRTVMSWLEIRAFAKIELKVAHAGYKKLFRFSPVVSHELHCPRISCESGSISIFELEQAIHNKPINMP